MWPLAWSAVPTAGPSVGVVTVLVALLDAESDEQPATVNRLATASRETGKRNIKGSESEKIERQRDPVGTGLALELLPEHEAQGGGQYGVEQAREQAAERTAGRRASGRFATIFHCGAGVTRKMREREKPAKAARRANEKARPGHSIAVPARALARRNTQTVSD